MICTKIVIIQGLFSLFAEYFRRIANLFASSYWGTQFTLPDSFEYSVNDGEWTLLTADTPISFEGENGFLRLRGKSSIGCNPAC